MEARPAGAAVILLEPGLLYSVIGLWPAEGSRPQMLVGRVPSRGVTSDLVNHPDAFMGERVMRTLMRSA
jgi:hypothetical protein